MYISVWRPFLPRFKVDQEEEEEEEEGVRMDFPFP